MFYIKGKNYSIILIVTSLLVLAPIYISIFKQIDAYDSSRIYTITKVPDVYRVSLMNKFLDKQYLENSILVVGDSQPHGFGYPEKYIFSTILAKQLNRKVINAAFRDARIDDNIYTLKYLKNKNMQFKTIIFNVNPAHLQEPKQQRLELNSSVDYKIGILEDSKYFRNFTNHFKPTATPNITFHKYQLSPNFFDIPNKSLKLYLSQLKKLISIAKVISKQVIIYASPHCISDVKRLKLNSINIHNLDKEVLNLCQENNVTFLKPEITKKEYFGDIVHFNAKGHIEMAEILYQVIK